MDPPTDGAIRLQLTSGGTELLRVREPIVGEPFVYDTVLELGDYELSLQAATPSIEPYQVSVERADAWTLPADLEPNEVLEAARDVPPTLVVEGDGFGIAHEDVDWYRIPAVADATQESIPAGSNPSGIVVVDTTRRDRASAGWSHSKVTPTTSSPTPRAKRISVVEGSRDTIRTPPP